MTTETLWDFIAKSDYRCFHALSFYFSQLPNIRSWRSARISIQDSSSQVKPADPPHQIQDQRRMPNLPPQRLANLRASRAAASGSSTWHSSQPLRSYNVTIGESLTPTHLTFAPVEPTKSEKDKETQRLRDGKGKGKEAVTLAPTEPQRPNRCRVRRGNGDSDGVMREERPERSEGRRQRRYS